VPRGSLVSVAAAPIIAAGVLGGPTFGAIVAVVGTLELREIRGEVTWYGAIYNHSIALIAGVISAITYIALTPNIPLASPLGLLGQARAAARFANSAAHAQRQRVTGLRVSRHLRHRDQCTTQPIHA
jgi:hypothetical protein